jgi:hypothetical protein
MIANIGENGRSSEILILENSLIGITILMIRHSDVMRWSLGIVLLLTLSCQSKKSTYVLAWGEAKSIARSLKAVSTSPNTSVSILPRKLDETLAFRLNWEWQYYPDVKRIGQADVIVVSKELFKIDYPSSRKSKGNIFLGINSKFQVVEISENHESVVVCPLVGSSD